jgi:copper chaperone CopZ
MRTKTKIIGFGVLTAIMASLCCITPVLALIAGTSGIASSFTYLEPLRPYLIGLTVVVLVFAWYQMFRPEKEVDCNCDTEGKTKFIHSKKFLGLVTLFTLGMLAFPYYSHLFYPKSEKQTIVVESSNIKITEFKISGMTCASCEQHVNHEVNKLNGIISSKASYVDGNAIIEFDQSKTSKEEIEKAINSTGYKVTDISK